MASEREQTERAKCAENKWKCSKLVHKSAYGVRKELLKWQICASDTRGKPRRGASQWQGTGGGAVPRRGSRTTTRLDSTRLVASLLTTTTSRCQHILGHLSGQRQRTHTHTHAERHTHTQRQRVGHSSSAAIFVCLPLCPAPLLPSLLPASPFYVLWHKNEIVIRLAPSHSNPLHPAPRCLTPCPYN